MSKKRGTESLTFARAFQHRRIHHVCTGHLLLNVVKYGCHDVPLYYYIHVIQQGYIAKLL